MARFLKKFFLPALLISSLLISCGSSDGKGTSNLPAGLEAWTGDKNYKSPHTLPELTNQSENLSANWWKNSSFYHIWIKSFKDSDSNNCSTNCGDFKGIEDSLDYIQNDLGCDAIWLSPFWDCSYKGSNMHGYDVNDFYKVNPYFGTGNGANAEAELESLIAACHSRGMKIIFDFVPNHTSDQNQWFKDSVDGKNGKSSWYMWNTKALDWKNTWGANSWHLKNGKYYYAAFANTQPDLNYRNYEVREEMKNVVRYWLNKGFDGLRIDAVRYLVENEDSLQDTPETHEWFAELRQVIDEYESPKFMVCEAWIEGDRTALNKYFGTDAKPEFNMVLDFDQGKTCIEEVLCQGTDIYYNNKFKYSSLSKFFANPDSNKAYGTFLGNHDEYFDRLGDHIPSESPAAALATSLSLLRPTVPFIYYGNEIAQKSGSQSGDERLRQPFNWTSANTQKNTTDSPLNVNKALLNLRKTAEYKEVFANGTVQILDIDMIYTETQEPWKHALAYTITNGSQKLLVVANLTSSKQNTLYFTNPGLNTDSYSLLVGNKDADTTIKTDGSDLLFYNFCSYEIRVYDLSSGDKQTVLDIWDHDSVTMYLRGTMNEWGATQMTFNSASGDFSVTVELTAGTKYGFKFDENADWAHSYGPKDSNSSSIVLNTEIETSDAPGIGTNFSFTPAETGNYTFIFHKNSLTAEIKK
ncbi:alpha-amylase family glycosyl hydrolase [uncultured Treponema sp.]|uniref:alpha-amylase family glycosyl hydrolase n=1 Tax=uncultured Treponema sp. TaxID=162155 RepID=UPI0025CFD0AB|nr:alpha-amylase family glycosyl hydrolase [uncultured Treponema sp.]